MSDNSLFRLQRNKISKLSIITPTKDTMMKKLRRGSTFMRTKVSNHSRRKYIAKKMKHEI